MKLLDRLEELAHNAKLRRLDFAQEMHDIVDELRPYFSPLSWQDESAPDASAHFKAWTAVYDELKDQMPGFDGEHTPTARAVAAIRSMAAQCSAQPAPAIPIAWPEPITSEQLNTLAWAQGYLLAKGFENAVEALAGVEAWLRKNGCDQIR